MVGRTFRREGVGLLVVAGRICLGGSFFVWRIGLGRS